MLSLFIIFPMLQFFFVNFPSWEFLRLGNVFALLFFIALFSTHGNMKMILFFLSCDLSWLWYITLRESLPPNHHHPPWKKIKAFFFLLLLLTTDILEYMKHKNSIILMVVRHNRRNRREEGRRVCSKRSSSNLRREEE